MTHNKSLTLSIVIPAYNEENYLGACLEAVASQEEAPDEVIVVDNNSTDNTVGIARSFSFVKVIHEKQQHQVYAQAAAFDISKTNIFARIDADTVLPNDWVRKVKAQFQLNAAVIAITGGADPYDVPLKRIGSWMFNTYHENVSRLTTGHVMLFGSNCAFRSSCWPDVKRRLHFRADIWEDYDLAFALAKFGEVRYVKDLEVGCSFRAAHQNIIQQFRYQLRAVRTIAINTSVWRTFLFTCVWSTLVFLYIFPLIDRYLWRWRSRR